MNDDKQIGYEYAKQSDKHNIDIYWLRERILNIASDEFMSGYDKYVDEKEA